MSRGNGWWHMGKLGVKGWGNGWWHMGKLGVRG